MLGKVSLQVIENGLNLIDTNDIKDAAEVPESIEILFFQILSKVYRHFIDCNEKNQEES